MNISILDLDYYENKQGFNTDCMKIASYHQQLGDVINFVTRPEDIRRPFDVYYITKREEKTKNPPIDLLNNDKCKIWGEGFKVFKNWTIPDYILGCRPNYLLYESKKTPFERAEMIQFFNDKGLPLQIKQSIENSFKNKKTLVIDKSFWIASEKDIINALDELQYYKNVAFSEPIWVKKIVCNKIIRKKFIDLNFTKNSKFRFKNNLGDSLENMTLFLDFIKEFKSKHKNIYMGSINFYPVLTNHYKNKDNAWFDFINCLKIIDYGKKNNFNCIVQPLRDRLSTPYWWIFDTLHNWTLNKPTISLLEYIAIPIMSNKKLSLEEVYEDSKHWEDERMFQMLKLIYYKKELLPLCISTWGNGELRITRIDWSEIEKGAKY